MDKFKNFSVSVSDSHSELQTTKLCAVECFAHSLIDLESDDSVKFHCISENFNIVVSIDIISL